MEKWKGTKRCNDRYFYGAVFASFFLIVSANSAFGVKFGEVFFQKDFCANTLMKQSSVTRMLFIVPTVAQLLEAPRAADNSRQVLLAAPATLPVRTTFTIQLYYYYFELYNEQ